MFAVLANFTCGLTYQQLGGAGVDYPIFEKNS
jgi:hypothetical protein